MRTPIARSSLILVSTLLAASIARADVPGSEDPTQGAENATTEAMPEPSTVEHHYGSETLTADAISAGVMVAGLFLPSTKGVVGSLGLGGYVLAAPAIHIAHGNPGRALGSLGLRLGMPVGLGADGVYVGVALVGKECNGIQCFGGFVVGAILGGLGFLSGMVGASVLDGAVLARERVPRSPVRTPALNVSPYVVPSQQGSSFGLNAAGAF
jgi:hypothetical protein